MRTGGRHVLAAVAVLASAALAAPTAAGASPDPAGMIDTRDGSLGAGFPMLSAELPSGLIQPGPDTALADGSQDPVNYDGYSYQDPDIRGFSLTHFDGAGIQIAGDLPFMPTTGQVGSSDPAHFASPYDHASEVARPGYYAVSLERYSIRVELTSTLRAAMMRLTFPSGTGRENVLAEVGQSINGTHTGAVSVVGHNGLQGWVKSDVGYRVYFDAMFNRRFSATGALPGGSYVSFDPAGGRAVTMRVGISYVDAAGAARNLQTEIPAATSFDAVERAARSAWNRQLNRIEIQGGGGDQRATFYDNLYRSLLMPSVFEDADGRYLGFDGKVHRVARGHHQYTALSLWDTYRTQLPLLEMVVPKVCHDVLVSLITDAKQNHGAIPRWVQANIDRGIMGGDSGSAALADGAAAGLLSRAQSRQALSLLTHQAKQLPPLWPREHLDAYLKYGYVPQDVDGIGAALTEEYAIDDNAVGQLAATFGDASDAHALLARAAYWKNLVNPANHFIQPRNRDGSWANPTPAGAALPYNPNFQDGYQEGTGWQYLWAVPQDPLGLAGAIGGVPVALKRLDDFFSTALNSPSTPAVPIIQQEISFFGIYYIGNQYTPANETDLWTPWFYDFYGQPWKTQKVARAEMQVYNSRPDGLAGNDDTGEMSAWYVLAALGIYHAAPGVDAWEISSPAFPQMVVREGARTLSVKAPGASNATPYVHELRLNGRRLTHTYLTTCQLRHGGLLSFSLGTQPDTRWGTGANAAPPSQSAPSSAVQQCASGLAAGRGA